MILFVILILSGIRFYKPEGGLKCYIRECKKINGFCGRRDNLHLVALIEGVCWREDGRMCGKAGRDIYTFQLKGLSAMSWL